MLSIGVREVLPKMELGIPKIKNEFLQWLKLRIVIPKKKLRKYFLLSFNVILLFKTKNF